MAVAYPMGSLLLDWLAACQGALVSTGRGRNATQPDSQIPSLLTIGAAAEALRKEMPGSQPPSSDFRPGEQKFIHQLQRALISRK